MKNKKRFILIVVILIFVISLVARLFAINNINYPLSGDAKNYHNMANNFLETGIFGYSTSGKALASNAYVTPGYPLFLAGIYSIFGNNEAEDIYAVKVIQAVLSSFTVLLVFLIGKKISNSVVGIIAAILMIIYPSFLAVPSFHLTETLYTFLFLIYLYVHLYAFESQSKKLHLLSGILFGIAVMVRPSIFPFFLVIYGYKWIVEKEKNVFKKLLIFVIGLLIVMVPWWVRNFMLFKKFILLCTQAGNPLLGGAYPPSLAPRRYPQENQLKEGILVIINGFKNYPKEYIKWFTIGKLKATFNHIYLLGFLPKLNFMEKIHFVSLYVGAIGAIFALFKKNARMIAVYIIMSVGVILLFIPDERYAFPVIPLFMILASYLCYEIVKLIIDFVRRRGAKHV